MRVLNKSLAAYFWNDVKGTLGQLLKEFAIPLILALAWTTYSFYETASGKWSVRSAVNTFGPSFFFVSWLLSQWFRVRKQQKVEGGLTGIQDDIKLTLSQLDEKTKDLIGYMTGGESACYLLGMGGPDDLVHHVSIVHIGKHPLTGIVARIVDIEALTMQQGSPSLDPSRFETIIPMGDLISGHARTFNGINLRLGGADRRAFNIFFTAKNGPFTQLLRFARTNNGWSMATKVTRGETILHEHWNPGFPLNDSGAVDW